MLGEVAKERARQDAKWGEQIIPLGIDADRQAIEVAAKAACDRAAREGRCTHFHVIHEEFWEFAAAATEDDARLELVQLAACCVKAVQQLDRKRAAEAQP